MHKQRIAILIASGVGVLAGILPWVTYMGAGKSGFETDGIFSVIAFIAAIVLVLVSRDRVKILNKRVSIITGALGLVALIFPLYIYNKFSSTVNSILSSTSGNQYEQLGAQIGASLVQVGVGLWLTIIAGVALAVVGFARSLFESKAPKKSLSKNAGRSKQH